MKKRTGEATAVIDAPPDHVFGLITDLGRLPDWNGRITAVLERPGELADGAEWSVRMKVMGKRFVSRSHVIELDSDERRFVYRSKPEDENPSFEIWTWEVAPAPSGDSRSTVTLAWELRPVTFVRKRFISVLRNRRIARTEAPAALAALAKACG